MYNYTCIQSATLNHRRRQTIYIVCPSLTKCNSQTRMNLSPTINPLRLSTTGANTRRSLTYCNSQTQRKWTPELNQMHPQTRTNQTAAPVNHRSKRMALVDAAAYKHKEYGNRNFTNCTLNGRQQTQGAC